MRIGVADAGGSNPNQNVGWADLWNWNICIRQRLAFVQNSNRFHLAAA
jgi:hypothetical protein